MDMLKAKHAVMEKERDKMLAEHDLIRTDIGSIESEMAEYVKTNEKLLNDMMAEYWNLRHDVDKYMGTLANKFGLRVEGVSLPAKAPGKKKKGEAKRHE
ncbi:hypothetical protein FRB99_006761 [Tulasnella sp. 403]|nr:hypothetical protein FRB99_006761 [Tulasnella sp. 403]